MFLVNKVITITVANPFRGEKSWIKPYMYEQPFQSTLGYGNQLFGIYLCNCGRPNPHYPFKMFWNCKENQTLF